MKTLSSKENRFQILSLDGGGLKGLFTACFLAEWKRITGREPVESFDLIAGTSAGGIIALALGARFSADEIVDFFQKHGPSIFPAPPTGGRLIRFARRAIKSGYSPKPLEEALDDYFGSKLLESSTIRLVVPGYHVERGVYIFKTPHHPRLVMDGKERMADIARATSAAPTYLPPLKLEHGLRLIDGGVYANNPVQIAVNEALGYLEIPQSEIFALRIGTGWSVPSHKDYSRDPGIGRLKNMQVLIDIMMRGQSQVASGGVQHILGPERFVEVSPVVAKGDYKLDQFSNSLCGLAKNEFRNASSNLRERGFLDHAAPSFPSVLSLRGDPHEPS